MSAGGRKNIAKILALTALAIVVTSFVAINILAHLAFQEDEGPAPSCAQSDIDSTLQSAVTAFPQLVEGQALRSVCPYSFSGGGAAKLLVLDPDSVGAGIPFSPYDGIIEWGPEGMLDLLPDLFPTDDLSNQMIATAYGQGDTYVMHLLRRVDGAGPVVLVWMWL